jgi:ATP-dependent Lon protease
MTTTNIGTSIQTFLKQYPAVAQTCAMMEKKEHWVDQDIPEIDEALNRFFSRFYTLDKQKRAYAFFKDNIHKINKLFSSTQSRNLAYFINMTTLLDNSKGLLFQSATMGMIDGYNVVLERFIVFHLTGVLSQLVDEQRYRIVDDLLTKEMKHYPCFYPDYNYLKTDSDERWNESVINLYPIDNVKSREYLEYMERQDALGIVQKLTELADEFIAISDEEYDARIKASENAQAGQYGLDNLVKTTLYGAGNSGNANALGAGTFLIYPDEMKSYLGTGDNANDNSNVSLYKNGGKTSMTTQALVNLLQDIAGIQKVLGGGGNLTKEQINALRDYGAGVEPPPLPVAPAIKQDNVSEGIEDKQTPATIEWVNPEDIRNFKVSEVSFDEMRKVQNLLARINPHKPILKIDDYNAFDALYEQNPNFREVTDFYKGSFIFNESKDLPKEYAVPTPVLLLGEAGIGKTHFAQALANLVKTQVSLIDANSISASWVLSGHSMGWKDAKPGMILRNMIECETASPIIIFDEIDKLTNQKSYDPFSTFHQLLEPENARAFTDEYLNIKFDASKIIYILTANDANSIPPTLLSRMKVFHINKPSADQARGIASRIYRGMLGSSKLFSQELNEENQDKLSIFTPREMKQILMNSIFTHSIRAAGTQDNNLELIVPVVEEKKSIGFLAP